MAPLPVRARTVIVGRRVGTAGRRAPLLLQAASLSLLLLLWTALVSFPGLEKVPDPLSVARAAANLSLGAFLTEAGRSLSRVTAGFLLGAAVGIPLGIAMGCWRTVRHLAFPPVEALRPIPPIAWIPLSILFFVSVESQIIFLTFYGAFFPITYNTVAGVPEPMFKG